MKKYSMKLSVLILAVIIFLLISTGCLVDTPPPSSAIFSGVTKIEISQTAGAPMANSGYFFYSLPEDVKYAIVELFPSGTTFLDNKTVPVDVLIAGSRTGFEEQGFTRSFVQANKLYKVNSEKTDFDIAGGLYSELADTTYVWIVLGYDENMILTHASPAGEVTVAWP
ncbi:MAG: hypothetical protein KAU17_11255 [Spirochaetales bacterium]|nr:hypothetical protein [Spirochaetales bacterium]